MMNVLTDILCDTSSMMPPQSYKVVMPQSKMSQHDISSEQGPLHLLESVSHMSSLDRPLNHSSPSEINLFDSSSQIHIPSNLDSSFEDRSNVSVFSDSFPEIVPSWLTHDFMKASDNLPSPGILSNVTDVYSTNRETSHLEMLDLGFPPELTSHNVSNNLNHCNVDSQKLSVELPMQRFSNDESLIIPSFNMSDTQFHISMNKHGMQQHNFKQNETSLNHSQSLMNSVLPCDNNLLHLPLPSNLTEQCLSSSSPSIISNSQSQSHVVCDKLPQINLNHLDSLLGNESALSEIQLLRHNFPDVRIGEDGPHPHSSIDTCNPNNSLMTNMISPVVPQFPHLQDASVQVSFEASNNANPKCFSCNNVDTEMPMEIINFFKCKFCDYISFHKCSVASHMNKSHSKMLAFNVSKNVHRSETPNHSLGGPSEAHFNSQNQVQEPTNITDLNKRKILPKQDDKVNKTANITALNSKKVQPKLETMIVTNSNKRKILPKKVENDQVLKKALPKKSATENNSEKNDKSISSHKKAWQKKMRRELGTYICESKGCNVRFRALDNLEYHKKCHGIGIRTFVCPECGANFFNWGAIAGHLWRTHGNDMELHKCDQCPFRTFSLSRLENIHKRIHGDECLFLCDTCGKNFKNGKQLRNHRVIHSKSKKVDQVECNICKNRFADKNLLMRHQNTVHLKIKPYVCKYCDYTASKKNTMEIHVRSRHTGEKPFKCDECDYCSTDHNTLRRHKMKHSGYKPYKCPLCTYSCNQASRFKSHLHLKHPDQNTGIVLSCKVCSFKTLKEDAYAKHMCEHAGKPVEESSGPEIQCTDDSFPEAMDILDLGYLRSNGSHSHGDNLSNFNKHKNIQSFFNNLNVNMVTVGNEGVNFFLYR